MPTAVNRPRLLSLFQAILIAWLVAGTLDITAAWISVNFLRGRPTSFLRIFQYIATSIFQKESYEMGWYSGFCGLAIHYCVALVFVVFYFVLCKYIFFLRRQKIVGGLVYGIFVWAVMNLLVLGTVFPGYHFTFRPLFWTEIVILMLCIGLPVGLATGYYYGSKDI